MILVERSSLEAGRGKPLASHPSCALLPHPGGLRQQAMLLLQSNPAFILVPLLSCIYGAPTLCPALPRVPSYKDKGSEGPAGI